MLDHSARRLISKLGTEPDRTNIKPPPFGLAAMAQITPHAEDEARPNFLQLPRSVNGPSATTLRRNNTYSHNMNSRWELIVDDIFSEDTLNQVLTDADDRHEYFGISAQTCGVCSTLDLSQLELFPIRTVSDFALSAEHDCELCGMILRKAQAVGLGFGDPITLKQGAGRLLLNGRESAALRVCCYYGNYV